MATLTAAPAATSAAVVTQVPRHDFAFLAAIRQRPFTRK
jgi:hypothetical protein